DPRYVLPPVDDNPLLWKERYLGRTIDGTTFADFATLLSFLLVLLAGFISLLAWNQTRIFETTSLFLSILVISSVILLMGLAFRLARTVSREREQRTLESLLTMPMDRREMLTAKWLGCLLRSVRSLLVVGTVLVVALLCGAFSVAEG